MFRKKLIDSWYQPRWFTYLLWPLAALYRFIIYVRVLFYRLGIFKQTKFTVPVIVVGNLTVGGTGKTPLVVALVNFLQSKGLTVGIVARGYGGKKYKQPRYVNQQSDPQEVGDEPLLLVKHTQAPTVVCVDRVAALEALMACHACDVVVTDDGLQHYALGRAIEIAVIDAKRQFGNGLCLPAGPLREPKSRLKSVHYRVYNGQGPIDAYSMHLRTLPLCNLVSPYKVFDYTCYRGKLIHAVAAIGHPQRFFNSLRDLGLTIIEHEFLDHHMFKASDIDYGDAVIIIMTEKDAVKCYRFADPRHWFLPVKAQLDPQFCESIIEDITAAKNQENALS